MENQEKAPQTMPHDPTKTPDKKRTEVAIREFLQSNNKVVSQIALPWLKNELDAKIADIAMDDKNLQIKLYNHAQKKLQNEGQNMTFDEIKNLAKELDIIRPQTPDYGELNIYVHKWMQSNKSAELDALCVLMILERLQVGPPSVQEERAARTRAQEDAVSAKREKHRQTSELLRKFQGTAGTESELLKRLLPDKEILDRFRQENELKKTKENIVT